MNTQTPTQRVPLYALPLLIAGAFGLAGAISLFLLLWLSFFSVDLLQPLLLAAVFILLASSLCLSKVFYLMVHGRRRLVEDSYRREHLESVTADTISHLRAIQLMRYEEHAR